MTTEKIFDSQWLERLRSANDLVTIISNYVPIVKKGRNFWANCPFHHEKTPSFCIYPDEQVYHCYGCGESGDVISFIRKIESLDFVNAIKFLADKCGMKLPNIQSNEKFAEMKAKKDRYINLMNCAKDYYKNNLYTEKGKSAMDYLIRRGVNLEQIEIFELGVSIGWNESIDYLKSKGYTINDLKEVGLIASKEDHNYDFFAFRLMFPICNKYGDCVGFSARDLQGKSLAKYKNSPQSVLFDKSNLLYALNIVKKNKNKVGIENIILCEGQMDVIAMHNAGFCNTVASLGTAFTPFQAREIYRVCSDVILCYDGDSAGQKAIAKAIPILEEQGLNISVVVLPAGQDPDDILKSKGREFMAQMLREKVDTVEYQINSASKLFDLKENVGKAKFIKQVKIILDKLSTQSEREVYAPLISGLLEYKVSNLSDLFVSDINKEIVNKSQNVTEQTHIPNGLLKAQQFVLASLLHNIDYAIIPEGFDLELANPNYIKLYQKIIEKRKMGKVFNLTNIFDEYGENSNIDINDLLEINFDDYKNIGEKHFKECLTEIEVYRLTRQKSDILKHIGQEKDLEMGKRLLQSMMDIDSRLKQLSKREE